MSVDERCASALVGVNATEGYYQGHTEEVNDGGYIVPLMFILFMVGMGFSCGWRMSRRWHDLCHAMPSTVVISIGLWRWARRQREVAVQYECPEEVLRGASTQCARPNADPEIIDQLTINSIRDELRGVYKVRLHPELRKVELVGMKHRYRAEDTTR